MRDSRRITRIATGKEKHAYETTRQIPMKNKFTFQSAFFNLRVLICLSVALAGVFLALLGLGGFCRRASTDANANTNTYLAANINTDTDGYHSSNVHSYTHSHINPNSDTNGNTDASSNTQTPSDSPAASTRVRNAVD